MFFILFLFIKNSSSQRIFNLVGDWEGENKSYSLEKGSRDWKKKITIFEQNERIFKGSFKYADGETNFLGTIRQNNRNFYLKCIFHFLLNYFLLGIQKLLQNYLH